MHNKSVFKISLILFLCIGLVFGMFLKLKDEIEDRKLNRLSKITFSNEETEMFEKAILWETQHEYARNIFLVLLLLVLRKKKQFLAQKLQK